MPQQTVAEKIRANLPACDFAVLGHGFTPYTRDYLVTVQLGGTGPNPGTHECLFTHCVFASAETRVRDDVWPSSWTDEFIDYDKWQSAGQPSGYVWGSQFSLAYPGLDYQSSSEVAAKWSMRLGKQMHEITIETEAYFLRLVFHDVRFRQLSNDASAINQVVNPL